MEHWFVKKEELVLGPYSPEELRGYVARGKVTPLDLVSRDGKAGWTAIHQVPQFHDVTRAAAAPAPPVEVEGAAPARAWYLARGELVVGPLNLDALRAAVSQGQVGLDVLACEVGATKWVALQGVTEIADLLPPPLPPATAPSVAPSAAPPAAPTVPSDPTVRLYTARQAWIAGWFGSWIAGAVLLISNERALGRDGRARQIVFATILSVIAFFTLSALLPNAGLVHRVMGLLLASVPYFYARDSQKLLVDERLRTGSTVHSWWRVSGIALASTAAMLLVMFGFAPAPGDPTTNTSGSTTASAGLPTTPEVPPPAPAPPVETIESRSQGAMAAVVGYLNAEQRLQPVEPYWCGPHEMPGRFHNLLDWRIRPEYVYQRRQAPASLPEWFRFTVDIRAANRLGGVITTVRNYYVRRYSDGAYRLLAQCEDDGSCEALLSADAIAYPTGQDAPCAFPRDEAAAMPSAPRGADDANRATAANTALPAADTEAFDFRRLAIERPQLNGSVRLCQVSHVNGPFPISEGERQLGSGLDGATVRLSVFCSPPPNLGPLVSVVFTPTNQAQSLSVRSGSVIAVEITPTDNLNEPVVRFRETR